MKRSKMYRAAARIVSSEIRIGCCEAIDNAGGHEENNNCKTCAAELAFGNTFMPQDCCSMYWWPLTKDYIPIRILALCFAAAIAEDEERAK